ncbi:transglutaminase domain-containing protein [Streptomyces sp. HUAS MG47]|uniref:transglutaminase domain-containing protein n=1 Tax=Streptomyces solicamelliae TaxID=3231716 RepID=UPI003877FDD9
MTSSILRPRRRTFPVATPAEDAAGGTQPTPILDRLHPRVTELVRCIEAAPPVADARPWPAERQLELLRRAHRRISATVRPVYSVQDERPVSEVLRRGRGSCSQRLAVLEAVARTGGVATRVRGLLVDGALWYPRFPRMRRLVPDHVVLAWPEFRIGDAWLPVSELFGGLEELSTRPGGGFTNAGPETLFEALSRTAVDWDGVVACPAGGGADAACDLAGHVVADLGHHDSRDALFARHGQTLCPTARLVAEPLLGRRSAGA